MDGDADEIVCSVEGFSFARLAAAQGKPEALLVMAEHCAHLAKVYADCGAPECAESWHGQALAVLELAAERLPDPSAAGLMDSLTLAAADAISLFSVRSAMAWLAACLASRRTSHF